jgi:hypothetical protein
MRKGYQHRGISPRMQLYVPLPGDIEVDHPTLLVLHGDNWRDVGTLLLVIKETHSYLAAKPMANDATV